MNTDYIIYYKKSKHRVDILRPFILSATSYGFASFIKKKPLVCFWGCDFRQDQAKAEFATISLALLVDDDSAAF